MTMGGEAVAGLCQARAEVTAAVPCQSGLGGGVLASLQGQGGFLCPRAALGEAC